MTRLGVTALATVLGAGLVIAASLRAPEQFFLTNMGALDASEPIPFFVHDGAGVAGYESSDRELAIMALDAWARASGNRLRFVESASEEDALIRLVWVAAGQGRFGEARRIHVDGKPGAYVFVMPDVEQLGISLWELAESDPLLRDTIVYLTSVHELGHAVGLPHTSDYDDIMYSFGFGGDIVEYFMRYRRRLMDREDIARNSGLSASDRTALGRLYPH